MGTTISVNKQSVKQLLESGKERMFVIPEYQRPYAWTDEQIQTLFEDLWNFSTKEKDTQKTYFLGSIVSYENNGTQEIIDGQQRITSLFLLLRAIYTKLSSTETKTKEALNFIKQIEPVIWRTNKLTGEVNFSDILLKSYVINDAGNEILAKILETGETKEGAKDNYSKNYKKFLELYEKASTDNPLSIYEFIYVLLNQAILLPITADNQETALTIFSTLNDRGLPLSDADIFKAKIYNNLPETEKQDFIENWKNLTEDAERIGESIQQLFYYYMFYLRALENDTNTTTPRLRKYFKDNVSKLYNKELLEELDVILNLWKVTKNREEIEEKWSKNIEILKILDILNSYPNEFWKYPVIIYYLKYRNDENFENNFLLFLRRFFTLLLIKYLESPTVNSVKSDILKLNVEIINTNKPYLNSYELKNINLIEKLKTPHSNTVRMLLKIMAYLEEEQTELLPQKWEIEHIFPMRWHNNYFVNVEEEIIKEKIEHLGNKIPFEKRLNIEAGNGYFGKKKELYKQSKICVANKMSNISREEWNLEDIENRDIQISKSINDVLMKWIFDYEDIER